MSPSPAPDAGSPATGLASFMHHHAGVNGTRAHLVAVGAGEDVRHTPSDVELLDEHMQPHQSGSGCGEADQDELVTVGEHLPACVTGGLVEAAVGGPGTGNRVVEVEGGVGRRGLVGDLASVAGSGELAVTVARGDAVGRIATTVGIPTQISRRSCWAAKTMARAGTSGW